MATFLPFLHNVCRNSAPNFSGRTSFYSASFEVSGRIFGQLATLGSQLALAAVQCSAATVCVCVCGGGGGVREGIRTSYSGIWPTAATCVCSVKKRKEIFLSGIHPKCSALISYSIKKRSIYERFEETVYPQEIKF